MAASRWLQALLLVAGWWACDRFAQAMRLPVNGGVLGMGLLLLLLALRLVRPHEVQSGAGWLLSEMTLFFMPAAVAVLDYPGFLGWAGLKLLLAVLSGTLAVMVCTGLTVDWLYRRDTQDRVPGATEA